MKIFDNPKKVMGKSSSLIEVPNDENKYLENYFPRFY